MEPCAVRIAADLSGAVSSLVFSPPVAFVYNPLEYAWGAHRSYLTRYARGRKKVVFLGMNPGPWGMVQTGVPFGDVVSVVEWLRIDDPIGAPPRQHPRRPVLGPACGRREVSGQRLWGLLRERFSTPRAFFADHFVANYCPLAFLEASGRNLTPDRLPRAQRSPLLEICDRHLAMMLECLRPEWAVGVGRFARGRIEASLRLLPHLPVRVAEILHPSPASPAANRGWPERVTDQLVSLGIWTRTQPGL